MSKKQASKPAIRPVSLFGKVSVFEHGGRWRWVGQGRYEGAKMMGFASKGDAIASFRDLLAVEKTIIDLLRASGPQSFQQVVIECNRQTVLKNPADLVPLVTRCIPVIQRAGGDDEADSFSR